MIITSLRTAIETGQLEPGTRLIEKELCEQLNVSRTSLREALRELQAEGVFEQTSSRGLTVCDISQDDAENAYRIRAVLEALIVQQFIEKSDDKKIQMLVEQGHILKAAYQSGVLEDILSSKRAFYDLICSGAENPIAFGIINRLVLRTSSLRWRSMIRPERQNQSIKEISLLVSAIQNRDIDAARTAAIEHVNNAARSALGPRETRMGDAMPKLEKIV
ncbi:MAG TPA: GntR family transcriptional regulator [Acidocella sp.]|nr:GntR family transcriptional regulator [Acidocella sp.]